jgi:hypothetical protein
MVKNIVFTLIICISVIPAFSNSIGVDTSGLEGRWDLTLMMDKKENPSWLEVRHSGHHTFVGHFVGVSGSARPISEITIDDNIFMFSIPPQWEDGKAAMRVVGTFTSSSIKGQITFPDGKEYSFTGVRAPALMREAEPEWGQPIKLISGDLKGWKALGQNQWVVEKEILRSPKSGANLVSEQKFSDFKLHIEFRYPKGSNSGVYLRGRYEVQITDSQGKQPLPDELGAVYGFITPLKQVAKPAGEWQTYDITIVGRVVTVVANGTPIIISQEIPGITGGAIDSKEGEPGPLLLQGDHGPIEYRNIIVTPAK